MDPRREVRWAHWSAQRAPEQGDWYARQMYMTHGNGIDKNGPFAGVAPLKSPFYPQLAEAAFRAISHTREDLTDLINAAIEELVRQRYELPAFRTLVDAARRIRAEINRQYYHSVYVALGKQRRQTIDDLLLTDGANRRSLWQSVKLDPGAPTLKEFRQLVERLKWLKSLRLHKPRLFAMIPPIKVRHLAQEAASLGAARMLEMDEEKCCALVAALVQQQVARCLDDLGEMIIRRMRKVHARARQALTDHLWQHQPDADQLIGVLYELLQTWRETADPQAKIAAFDQIVGDRMERLLTACQSHAVHVHKLSDTLLGCLTAIPKDPYFSVRGIVDKG
jgi:hypothetical protein